MDIIQGVEDSSKQPGLRYLKPTKEYRIQTSPNQFESLIGENAAGEGRQKTQSKQVNIEFVESGEKINRRTAVLILLSISFGVGYLFLPLSYFVKETWISFGLLLFNFISGFIAVYMLMDLRAQVNLGSYQEVAYYLSGQRSSIMGISLLFAFFFAVNCSVYLQLLAMFTKKFIENLAGYQLFSHSMQVIIIIEAGILIPMCKVLNFQKFRYLIYPILVSVCIIFMSLVFKLVQHIVTGQDYDFCEMFERNQAIPSASFGVTYATVIPSLCYAFGFHIYALQVHKVLDTPDPNGYQGMIMGLWTLSTMLILYLLLLLITSFYGEPHLNTEILYVFDAVFNGGRAFEYVTQLVVIVQLFCHTPFIFYIAQEQLMMFYDEYNRKSVSSMIDEIKKINDGGAKQYVMRETVNEFQCNATNNETEIKQQITIKSYRLPYMTLDRSILSIIFYSLFGVVTLLALLEMEWFVNTVSAFGATCVPLSLYVIPGYYYSEFHKGYNKSKYLSGRVFAIFGVIIMVVYTALVLYSDANFETAQEE